MGDTTTRLPLARPVAGGGAPTGPLIAASGRNPERESLRTILDIVGVDAVGLAPFVLIVFVGAVVKGYSGFGASMLWVTGLSLLLPPLEVVPMVLMFEIVSSVHLLPAIWRRIDWRSVGLLLVGTLAATPAGVYALAALPVDPARIVVAVVVLLATALLWRGFALEKTPGKAATVAIGLFAGLMNGGVGFVGPAVVLFYFSSPIGVAISRASIITFFLGTGAAGAGAFAVQGLVTGEVLARLAVCLPILFLGVWIGHRRFESAEPESFRKFGLLLLMFLAAALVARAVWP